MRAGAGPRSADDQLADALTCAAFHAHYRGMGKVSALPPELEQRLADVGKCLEKGHPVGDVLPRAIAGLAALPPTAISQVASKVGHAAKLYHRYPGQGSFLDIFRKRLNDKEQLLRFPDLKFLFLFHFDGRLREAAVQRIADGLPSPFFFAAMAVRLNDWVEPVRRAALASAARCFPKTNPDVVAAAAEALLLRQDSWGRWGNERQAVDAAFERPDVAESLAVRIANSTTGPSSRILRKALRAGAMDVHLERLAKEAKQPSVRALAVQALADGKATWQSGWQYKWIDKSMGMRTRVPQIEERALTIEVDRTRIVQAAAGDQSALVRRQALDAVIRYGLGSAGRQIATDLTNDRSPSLRERAAFILDRSADASAER